MLYAIFCEDKKTEIKGREVIYNLIQNNVLCLIIILVMSLSCKFQTLL